MGLILLLSYAWHSVGVISVQDRFFSLKKIDADTYSALSCDFGIILPAQTIIKNVGIGGGREDSIYAGLS